MNAPFSSTSSLARLEHWLMEGFWNEHGDPRLFHLSLMRSFRIPLATVVLYLAFVLYFGPRWMRNRKPFSLKGFLLTYNLSMVLINGYFFTRLLLNFPEFWRRSFDTTFPSLTETSNMELEIIFNNYLFMLSKYLDLIDTVLFVLRKKTNQVTALHLYHHSTVAFFGWITFRLCGICNPVAPFAFMNTFIHAIMYSYYCLASLGPHMQPYLWWKRYLTQLQIVQFIVLLAHALYFVSTQTGYSAYYKFNYAFNTVVYLFLFTRFYIQTYKGKENLTYDKLSQKEALKIE